MAQSPKTPIKLTLKPITLTIPKIAATTASPKPAAVSPTTVPAPTTGTVPKTAGITIPKLTVPRPETATPAEKPITIPPVVTVPKTQPRPKTPTAPMIPAVKLGKIAPVQLKPTISPKPAATPQLAPLTRAATMTASPKPAERKPVERKPAARMTAPTGGRARTTPKAEKRTAPKAGEKDLVRFAKDFFGDRNDVTFEAANLREGLNFTNETLSYMTPHGKADKITNFIVSLMPYRPFTLYECCSGIGGNAMSFLDHPAIREVYSHEIEPSRRAMLKRNIAAYGLDGKSVVSENPNGFAGVPADKTGVVLYFDPPWLPKEIPGHLSHPNQYIRQGMTIGPYTLEEWMARSPNVAMAVFRVPPPYPEENMPGYQMGPVPGWKCDYNDTLISKSRLVVCVNENGMKLAEQNVVTLTKEEAEDEWKEKLRNLIREKLLKILKPEHAERYLADDVFPLWMKAFTHETFDKGFNYEEMEKIGDSFLKLAFDDYIIRKFPSIKKNVISALNQEYMSKKTQKDFAKMEGFGLPGIIRAHEMIITTHILEDVFEAFFGALFEVSKKIHGPGAAYLNSSNYLNQFLNRIKFDLEKTMEWEGGAPSQIKVILNKIGFPVENLEREITQVIQNVDGFQIDVVFPPAVVQLFANNGVKIPPKIGTGYATTKNNALRQAYETAYRNMLEMGINRDWAEQVKKDREFAHYKIAPYLPAAAQRLDEEGYASMYFYLAYAGKGRVETSVQLIGVRPDGSEVRLSSAKDYDEFQAKADALQKYAEGY